MKILRQNRRWWQSKYVNVCEIHNDVELNLSDWISICHKCLQDSEKRRQEREKEREIEITKEGILRAWQEIVRQEKENNK